MSGAVVGYARSRRLGGDLGLATAVGAISIAALGVRMPVPLSEVGASVTLAAVCGVAASLPLVAGLARGLGAAESVHRPALRRLRLWHVVALAGWLLALAAASAALRPGPAAAAFAAHAAAALGLAALAGALVPAAPGWWLPVVVLVGQCVLGVDRRASEARGWAWWLQEKPIGWPLLLDLGIAVLGALCFVYGGRLRHRRCLSRWRRGRS